MNITNSNVLSRGQRERPTKRERNELQSALNKEAAVAPLHQQRASLISARYTDLYNRLGDNGIAALSKREIASSSQTSRFDDAI